MSVHSRSVLLVVVVGSVLAVVCGRSVKEIEVSVPEKGKERCVKVDVKVGVPSV